MPDRQTTYVLSSARAEHARLIRQAAIFDPFTERLFRDAGLGLGQRVLDVGSGVGDVAMLAARLVGPSGTVVAVERDPATLTAARSRAAEAGFGNVSFIEGDVASITSGQPFDAAVGRLILQYLPDPAAIVRSLAALVHPGGLLAFQDVWPASLLPLNAHLPLRAKCAALVRRTSCIWTWSWFSIARSARSACLHRTCASKSRSATTRTSSDGSTIFSLLSYRASRRRTLSPPTSATSRRSRRGSR